MSTFSVTEGLNLIYIRTNQKVDGDYIINFYSKVTGKTFEVEVSDLNFNNSSKFTFSFTLPDDMPKGEYNYKIISSLNNNLILREGLVYYINLTTPNTTYNRNIEYKTY